MTPTTRQSIQTLMDSSGVKFGTSGARGLAADMTAPVCYAYAAAFLQVVGARPGGAVALGMDLRPSSPGIAAACAAAIRDAGLEPVFCGVLPTPALAYFAQERGMPAIMVTGSHIPFDRNGIKFYRAEGEITKADEAGIAGAEVSVAGDIHAVVLAMAKRMLPTPTLPTSGEGANCSHASGEGANSSPTCGGGWGGESAITPTPDAAQLYRRRYLDFFPANILAGMRLGFYEHSSVARDLLRDILEGLGAQVISLGRTDQFVPIDTEAVAEVDIRRARDWAAEHRFDAILSTDGDADRPLLGDERGDWLRGDVVGILCAQYLGARAVATPVSSNTALEKCGAFERIARTRIGSPFVIAGMEQLAADGATNIVGFEANGGFLLGSRLEKAGRALEPLPTRDAVLPILALLAMAREQGVPVSRLATGLPPRYTASDRLQNFPTEQSRALLASLAGSTAALAEFLAPLGLATTGLDQTDGLRITLANGEILHLRPSGNAPELRCYAEAESQERANELAKAGLARVGNWRS